LILGFPFFYLCVGLWILVGANSDMLSFD